MLHNAFRRAAAAGGVVLLATALVGAALTGGAGAAGESVTVTPNSNLADAQSVTVDVTTTSATPASVFIAVTQCGNATSAGVPLSAVGANDCAGAEALGTGLQLLGFPSGAVPAGTTSTPLTLIKTNIGANHAQCLPVPPATIPCQVQAATANLSGAYTGPGYNFQAAATIAYVAPVTTTGGATTTAAPTTVAPTTVAPTTVAPTTRAPASTSIAPAATTFVIPPPTGGVAVASNTASTKPQLAATGSNAMTWWVLAIGLALLDFGYLALSSTWTKRRRWFRKT
jgi:hypothetical protein